MDVNPSSAEAQSEFAGVTFYFCSQDCKTSFETEPRRYLDESDLAEARAKQERQER